MLFDAYIHASFLVMIYMTAMFFFAWYRKDNSIADVAWGVGLIMIAWYAIATFALPSLAQVIVTVLVIVWGVRLSTHIYLRNKGKGEDYRYAQWRRAWGKWFLLRSYWQVFVLQGLLMLLVASPILVTNTTSYFAGGEWMLWLGVSIWICGFVFESVGDYQLKQFVKSNPISGKIFTQGLWKYTRHPNYFGEVVMWWGIGLIAWVASFSWVVWIGPITITILIRFVSGVPMLERKYIDNQVYQSYVQRTNALFPWKPRKS